MIRIFFLRIFLRSADDLIAFLNQIEARLLALAEKGYAEADRLASEAQALRVHAIKAERIASRIAGAGNEH